MTPHQLIAEFNTRHKKYKFPVILLDFVFKIYTRCMSLCEQIDVDHSAIELVVYLPDHLANIERIGWWTSPIVTNLSKKLPVLRLKNGRWSLKLNKPYHQNMAFRGSIFSSINCNSIDQALMLGKLLNRGYEKKHLRKNSKGLVNIDISLDTIQYLDIVYTYFIFPDHYILHPGDFL